MEINLYNIFFCFVLFLNKIYFEGSGKKFWSRLLATKKKSVFYYFIFNFKQDIFPIFQNLQVFVYLTPKKNHFILKILTKWASHES